MKKKILNKKTKQKQKNKNKKTNNQTHQNKTKQKIKTKTIKKQSHGEAAELEQGLFDYLSKRLYESKHTIEYEDIVSGRGLVYCYEYLLSTGAKGEKDLDAGQVAKAALKDDETAKKALAWHYEYLMRNTRSLCVSTQAKGVLLCGDNQV